MPKLKAARNGPTVLLHRTCHHETNAGVTEAELARDYARVEALRAHPRISRFVEWVSSKDPAFHSRSVGRGWRRR